ncbi:MAG: DUF4282 domain-containing protein [Tessaracoccus sp.]
MTQQPPQSPDDQQPEFYGPPSSQVPPQGGSYGQTPPGDPYGQTPPGAPYGQTPPGYQYAAPTPPSSDDTPFFKALFDFSFRSFVTIKFASVIYGIGLALIGLAWLTFIVTGFNRGFLPGLGALILGGLIAAFYVVIVRIGLEFSVAMIRTAQNTSIIADASKK